MLIAASAILIAGTILFVLFVRDKDLPAPAPQSPFQHLDDRKAAIYENLRDLQFEYRVGKLSEVDYQKTKTELQRELAKTMADIDELKQKLGVSAKAKPAAQQQPQAAQATSAAVETPSFACPHCGARFERELKFCGECGKPMAGGAA
jgi:hypothetical protein